MEKEDYKKEIEDLIEVIDKIVKKSNAKIFITKKTMALSLFKGKHEELLDSMFLKFFNYNNKSTANARCLHLRKRCFENPSLNTFYTNLELMYSVLSPNEMFEVYEELLNMNEYNISYNGKLKECEKYFSEIKKLNKELKIENLKLAKQWRNN